MDSFLLIIFFSPTKDFILTLVGMDSVFRLSPTLRIVNKTSTEATLAPGIDQQYSTNSLAGVHNVVQLGLSHNNIDLYGAHN